ncbi:TatD family hydrolase [Novosphingobium pokkalii]|uniref:TatD family hydrolase n=1 Tax=Novosphingobium pokkalii TaxID=1770194 RepID=UPI00363B47D4
MQNTNCTGVAPTDRSSAKAGNGPVRAVDRRNPLRRGNRIRRGPEFKANWGDQIEVFEHALAICRAAGGRVMSLHSRRAAKPVLDTLESFPDAGTPILHWFSGTSRELDRAIDLGCWFSVGPAMLRGEKGRQLVARMPRARVLTESDGPFAQIDGRSVWPWEASNVLGDLATLWGEQDDCTAKDQILENLRRIGRIADA